MRFCDNKGCTVKHSYIAVISFWTIGSQGKNSGGQWLSWKSVRLGIKFLLIRDSQESCVVSLSKALYPLLSTGSTQEVRKSSQLD